MTNQFSRRFATHAHKLPRKSANAASSTRKSVDEFEHKAAWMSSPEQQGLSKKAILQCQHADLKQATSQGIESACCLTGTPGRERPFGHRSLAK